MIIRNAHVFIDGKFNDVDVRYDETGIQEIGKGLRVMKYWMPKEHISMPEWLTPTVTGDF